MPSGGSRGLWRGHAGSLVADLPHDVGGRDFGKEQRCNDDGTDDGFRAVEGQIAGRADKGQQHCGHTFRGKLEDFQDADGSGANAERDQF